MSTKCCCVSGCFSRIVDGVPLHRFPNPNTESERFWRWVKNVGIKEMGCASIYQNRRVCRKHFEDIYLYPNNNLCKLAIPVLNIPGKSFNKLKNFKTSTEYILTCRAWVKFVGNEDLAYLSVNKLHELKFVCKDHFTLNSFTKSKKRLKKTAVPSINASNPPLPDEIINQFPVDQDSCSIRIVAPTDSAIQSLSSTSQRTVPKKQTLEQLEVSESYEEQLSEDCEDYTSTGLFSWNKGSETITQTAEYEKEGYQTIDGTEDVLIYNDLAQDKHNKDKDSVPGENVHEDFQCNICKKDISGFRYVCAQCLDYDICSGCEALGSHASHYMLRVPGPRPYEEVQSILESIRRQLLNTSILLNSTLPMSDSIKLELKNEEEQVLDPLQNVLGSLRESGLQTNLDDSSDTPQQEQDIDSVYDERTELPFINTSNKLYTICKRKLDNQNKNCKQDVRKNTRLHIEKKPKVLLNKMFLLAKNEKRSINTAINENRSADNMELCENIRGNLANEDRSEEISKTSRNQGKDRIEMTTNYRVLNASELNKLFKSDEAGTSSRQIHIKVDHKVHQQSLVKKYCS